MDEVEYKLKKRNAVLAVNVSISNVTQSFYQAVKNISFISFIVHLYCYTCNTGLVQLYITRLQYMYKV
jgi:hypothetical protein